MPTTYDPAAHGWMAFPDEGFIDHVGPIWTKHDAGGSRFGFVADRHHANLIGSVR